MPFRPYITPSGRNARPRRMRPIFSAIATAGFLLGSPFGLESNQSGGERRGERIARIFSGAGGMNRRWHRQEQFGPELADYVFAQLPFVLYSTIGLSTLVAVVLREQVSPWVLGCWLTAVYVISLLRWLMLRWRRSGWRQPPARRWLQGYAFGALVAGLAWGLMPTLFYSRSSPQTNIFLAFVVGGLISGASSSMAPLRRTMAGFTALLCVPLATAFFWHGDGLQVAMGTMLLVYGGAYLGISGTTARMILESLNLRNQNVREIEERRKAEAELRSIKEDLEETVAQRTQELEATNRELRREVEERLQAESRMRVSEQRFRSLVESTSDWIWEVDRDGAYTYSSPSVEGMIGFTAEEMVGKRFYELMPPDEAERTRGIFYRKRARGEPLGQLVNRCLHRDGSERIVETSGEPVFDEAGVLTGYRGIDRDITLRVKQEEETRNLEHLKSLGLLAGGMAHDFNNLLTVIYGNIEWAQLQVDGASPAGQSLAAAVEAMEKARRLTGQLLTFAQGGNPAREPASIRDIVRESCRLAIHGSGVHCDCRIAEDLWMTDIDRNQIWQVLSNILTNARDAMPEGGAVWVRGENVTLGATSAAPLPPGRYVKLTFRDEGVGIGEEASQHVFDPYYTTKSRGATKGAGIGLAVCHSVIKKHGGHITISSTRGKGTTVSVFLPARTAGTAGAQPSEDAADFQRTRTAS